MEAQQGKPKVSYADFIAARKNPEFAEFSVAWVLQLYIDEMNGKDGKRAVDPLGGSNQYIVEALQRMPIGAKDARKLTEDDIIDHCKMRIEKVCAATVIQDVGYLNVALKYIRAARRDCKGIAAHVIHDVRPFLLKNGYIGKSRPRTRVPTDAELTALFARAALPPKRPHKLFIYAMPDIIAFALVSTRRIGEICRITHSDIDWGHLDDEGRPAPIYTVRKMKHPTKKDHTKSFPLYPEIAEIIRRQPRKPGDDRIFPFCAKSVGAKYTRFKIELGIQDLRFHDNRREAITRALKKYTPHQVRHYYSGHDSVKMIESNYDATDPADGFSVRAQAEQRQSTAS